MPLSTWPAVAATSSTSGAPDADATITEESGEKNSTLTSDACRGDESTGVSRMYADAVKKKSSVGTNSGASGAVEAAKSGRISLFLETLTQFFLQPPPLQLQPNGHLNPIDRIAQPSRPISIVRSFPSSHSNHIFQPNPLRTSPRLLQFPKQRLLDRLGKRTSVVSTRNPSTERYVIPLKEVSTIRIISRTVSFPISEFFFLIF